MQSLPSTDRPSPDESSRTPPAETPHLLQIAREKAQRDAAVGIRAKAVLNGEMGPVLRRWVSVAIVPTATRLQALATALSSGDTGLAAELSTSPVFGLPAFSSNPDLLAVLEWALKDNHANDLVLAALGSVISALAAADAPMPLTRMLCLAGDAARETALGQFLTQVQGAKAMLQVRASGRAGWKQRNTMDAVGALLSGQVRSALDAKAEMEELPLGGRTVVSVLMLREGAERRIDLRPPSPADWALLDVSRRTKGVKDPHMTTWVSFAMLVLCCAQAEAGWFDLGKMPLGHLARLSHHRSAHALALSEDAKAHIKKDLARWLSMGFVNEPMLVPPALGDYLTVKHREVSGSPGPLGMKTNAKSTAAWEMASSVLASTAWTVPAPTLAALRDSELVQEMAARSEPDATRRGIILASYRRLAQDEFYLPIFMDFRGRVYTRPTVVTYQGRDLQKSLLSFPAREPDPHRASAAYDARVLHISGLYGGPGKLDKRTFPEREAWMESLKVRRATLAAYLSHWDDPDLQDLLTTADEPLQLLTALTLRTHHAEADRMACQIDGTCNGLQHLTALFRDEVAAPHVNLTESTLLDTPGDLYSAVAEKVAAHLDTLTAPWARRLRAAIKIDRKLCKQPVMVLPYGGTRGAVDEAVLAAILEQGPEPHWWMECRYGVLGEAWLVDIEAVENNYLAFKSRPLAHHPLLHLDAKRLAGVVWGAIQDTIPKAMQAMQALRDIAKTVGDRALEWETPSGLWVVEAKAEAARGGIRFKGLELPSSVRGLSLRPGRDKVDPRAHVSGIVANFIHSQDAAHLSRTMHDFRTMGGGSFGAIHDCFLGRPSEMGALGNSARMAFSTQYLVDPLGCPVQLRDGKSRRAEVFATWHDLAEAAGVAFPERGTWDPREVLKSAWFFS